jgi:hypothetical protein
LRHANPLGKFPTSDIVFSEIAVERIGHKLDYKRNLSLTSRRHYEIIAMVAKCGSLT